jgi:hypothetical protein
MRAYSREADWPEVGPAIHLGKHSRFVAQTAHLTS